MARNYNVNDRYDLSKGTGILRGMGFYPIYNGEQQDQKYTYATGTDNNIRKIYSNYVSRTQQDFVLKHGYTPEEFIEESEIQSLLFNKQSEFLKSFFDGQEKYDKTNNLGINSMKELQNFFKDENNNKRDIAQIQRDLQEWQKTTQKYIDTVCQIPDDFYKSAQGQKAVLDSGFGNIKDEAKVLTLSSNAYTLVKNSQSLLDQLGREIKNIDNLAKKVESKTKFTTVKHSASSIRGESAPKAVEKDAVRMMETIKASMTSLKGFIFEIAVADALYKQLQDLFGQVEMVGTDKSITVKGAESLGAVGTSKTDVKIGDINLSLKNQIKGEKGQSKTTAAFTTTLFRLARLGVKSDKEAVKLVGVFHVTQDSDSLIRLKRFMAAIVADFAIGGGTSYEKNDRIDFMVFRNKIIPLSKYIESVQNSINLNTTGTNSKLTSLDYGLLTSALKGELKYQEAPILKGDRQGTISIRNSINKL